MIDGPPEKHFAAIVSVCSVLIVNSAAMQCSVLYLSDSRTNLRSFYQKRVGNWEVNRYLQIEIVLLIRRTISYASAGR